MIGIFHRIGKSINKAGEILTGIGPTPSKQFKNAIIEEDEERAITIYTSVENEKSLVVDLHPSQPFPTKKTNQISETPLHLAAKYGLIKLVLLLLKHGGDPSNTNSRNETCLHCVCSQSNNPANRAALIDELVNWNGFFKLLDGSEQPMEKVSVNHIDVDGNAAIHYAAASGLLQCVEKLVLLGAIISIVNKGNITCCEMADEKDHKPLALMLELALVFQPVDESMLAFDSFQFDFDGVPGKVLLSTVSLTLGGVNDFIEDAIRFVGQVVGGDLLKYRCRTEVLLEAANWDVEALVQQYVEDPEKMLKTARLEPIRTQEERDAEKFAAAALAATQKPTTPVKDVTAPAVEESSNTVDIVDTLASSVVLSEDLIDVSFVGEEGDEEETAAAEVAVTAPPMSVSDGTTTTISDTTTSVSSSVSRPTTPLKSSQSEVDAITNPTTTSRLVEILSAAHTDVTTTTEECAICGDNMLRSVDVTYFNKGTVLEPDRRELRCLSGHAYCVSCWSSHLHVQVSDKGLGCMPCPGYKCGEILDTQWAPVMLKSQELVNRLLLQRQRHVVDLSGLKSCPVEACGLFVCVPSAKPKGVSRNSTPSRPIVEHTVPLAVVCGNGHSFCLSCAQVAHSPLSCSDFPNWHTQVQEETKNSDLKEGSSGDDMANAMWVAANTKRCPRCSTPIEKDEGCNHMCCRKCRKEFCWICMQDWSLHSDNTGGYFQCNRYRETPQGEGDVFAEEMGSAAAETMRLRNKGARMARFIHYFTRFQAHRDSVKMEGRMQKETLTRIADGLRASRDGKLRWLQQGNGVLNPLAAIASGSIPTPDVISHEKNDSNGNSSSSSSSSPVVVRQTSRNKNEHSTVTLSQHAMKTDECLSFLSEGFEELLKCRDILQWSYPYAYFEFEDRTLNDYSSFSTFDSQTRRQRARREDHRTVFEMLQAEMESMVETLSDVVARRRLRAGQNQISLATRAAKSKRLELESHLIAYSIAKQDKGQPTGGFTPPQTIFSTPQRDSAPRIRTGGSVQQRSNRTTASRSGSRQQQRHSSQRDRQGAEEHSDDEEIDLAALLLEMEMASSLAESREGEGGQTSSDGTPASNEQLSADRQRAANTLRLRINEMLNPAGGLYESGAFDFQPANLFAPPPGEGDVDAPSSASTGTTPLPSPQRGTRRSVGERNSSRSASRSGVSRHSRGERRSSSDGPSTSANSSPMTHMTYSSLPRPPQPPRSRPTRLPGVNHDSGSQDNEDSDVASLLNAGEEEEEGDSDEEDVGLLIRNIESAAGSPDRRRSAGGGAMATPSSRTQDDEETGGRVARDVASEMRLARLTRRAEEEASLNRAILMSLQDPARRSSDQQSVQSEGDIESLMNMGFPREDAIQALRETRNNVELAANRLLGV